MNDLYYVSITVIFGLFVLFIMWWLYKWLKKPVKITLNPNDEYSEETLNKIGKYCATLSATQKIHQNKSKKKTTNKNK